MYRLGSCFLLAVVNARAQQAASEDPQLRSEAVRLLERAMMLTTPTWPANEEFFKFKVMYPAPGEASEGTMKIGVKTTGNKRWEFVYGAYKFFQVQNGPEYATYRTAPVEPAVVTAVRKLVPVYQGQFDASDVIRNISEAKVYGIAARCIDFETIRGAFQGTGKVCVDSASGFLLSIRQGKETIRQSVYYRFNDASLPGHIERWVDGEKIFEIDSKVAVRKDFEPEYFDYPQDAKIMTQCKSFHRAFADQTPQPEAKTFSQELVTVKVHGRVGKDGKPMSLKLLSLGVRQDLADEALTIVAKWTFHPAQCEYQASTQEMDFEVVFKGW